MYNTCSYEFTRLQCHVLAKILLLFRSHDLGHYARIERNILRFLNFYFV